MARVMMLLFILIQLRGLNASGVLMNRKVTPDDLEKLSLRLNPESKYVKQKQLRMQYPWLDSRDELNKELLRIAKCFSENSNDKDVWVEFKPLLKSFMLSHELSEDFGYHIRTCAVSEFCFYSFANEDETELIKADFSGRKDCLEYICKFMYVFCPGEIEYLGAWLATARFLPEDAKTKESEFLKAEKKDMEMIYRITEWNLKFIDESYSQFKYLRPEWKKTEEKFKFRSIYNKNLAAFRTFAFTKIRKAILTGHGDGTNAKREKIWNEFCSKAKVTEAEKVAAEKVLPMKKEEEKKTPDKNKDIEVPIEI